MSDYTYAAMVPYSVRVWNGEFIYHLAENIPLMVAVALMNTEEEYNEIEGLPKDFDGSVNGWRTTRKHIKDIAKGGTLCPYVWQKDGITVWAINESQYQAGGYMELTFYAKERQHLVKFMKDVGLNKKELQKACSCSFLGKIEKDRCVTQTL